MTAEAYISEVKFIQFYGTVGFIFSIWGQSDLWSDVSLGKPVICFPCLCLDLKKCFIDDVYNNKYYIDKCEIINYVEY